MTIEELITEMQAVKQANPSLEIPDVLQLFEIQAMKDLNNTLRRLNG